MADPGEELGWPGAPLFLDQNEARRAEKIFFLRPPPPPSSQGLDDRQSPPPVPLSEGHTFQGIMVIFRVKMLILTMLSVLYYTLFFYKNIFYKNI